MCIRIARSFISFSICRNSRYTLYTVDNKQDNTATEHMEGKGVQSDVTSSHHTTSPMKKKKKVKN